MTATPLGHTIISNAPFFYSPVADAPPVGDTSVLSALFFSSGAVSLVFTIRGHDPGWVTAYQLWLLSGVLIALGMIQLIRFFSKYPKPKKEVSYAR